MVQPSDRMPASPTQLSVWPVAIGGAIGILVGLFLGDYAHLIRPVGEVYVLLLEVAVYPYLICSLLHGLGSMAPAQAYVPEKTPLLSVLEGIRLASLKFWNGFVRFAPVAVFALFAALAGTIRPRAMAELWIFLFLFFTGALILTFWIVPGCIAAFTPFKHKRGAAGPQVSTPDRCRDYAFRFRAALHFFRNPTPGQGLWH